MIRSESVPGLSSIVHGVRAEGTDIYRARQLVEERLTQAHALPNVSKPPTLLQPLSSSNRVLMIGLSSDKLTPIEQSVIARWTVRPRLMGVPGVANVSVWGMRDQQLQVQVDPERLREQGVTLSQVIRTAGNAQVVSPLTFLEASTPGHRRVHRDPAAAAAGAPRAREDRRPRRAGQGAGRGHGRPTATRAMSRRSSVDHQPLIGDAVVAGGPGLDPGRREVPRHQHTRGDRGRRGGPRDTSARADRDRTDTTVFRPAAYIDSGAGQPRARVCRWARADAAGPAGAALPLAGGACRAGRRPAVARHGRPAARVLGQGFNAIAARRARGRRVAVVVDEAVAPTDRVVRRLRERKASGRLRWQ